MRIWKRKLDSLKLDSESRKAWKPWLDLGKEIIEFKDRIWNYCAEPSDFFFESPEGILYPTEMCRFVWSTHDEMSRHIEGEIRAYIDNQGCCPFYYCIEVSKSSDLSKGFIKSGFPEKVLEFIEMGSAIYTKLFPGGARNQNKLVNILS